MLEGILVFVVIIMLVIIANIKIVPQANSYVVERLGAYHASWDVGLHIKLPFIEKIAKFLMLYSSSFKQIPTTPSGSSVPSLINLSNIRSIVVYKCFNKSIFKLIFCNCKLESCCDSIIRFVCGIWRIG